MALFCTPTSVLCKHIFSSCRNFKASSHPYSTSTSRQFAAKIKKPSPNPARRAPTKSVESVSKSSEWPLQDVNITAPQFASSATANTERHSGQAHPLQHTSVHRAMIALGSNIGDRISMIEQACEKMPERAVYVKRTSLLYETAPMYVTDQNTFYNGVCEVRS
jgi:7,8-dihydro-6-hydroxymethylpterin-pyrophosphokinase (HPPK)